jgi:hypothetical protein
MLSMTIVRNESLVRANGDPQLAPRPRTRSDRISIKLTCGGKRLPGKCFLPGTAKCTHINGKLPFPMQDPSLLLPWKRNSFHLSNAPSKALVPAAASTASIRSQTVVPPADDRRATRLAIPVSSSECPTTPHPRSSHKARPTSPVATLPTTSTYSVSLAISPGGGDK